MRYFRGWAITGNELHVQLWNSGQAPITLQSIQVTFSAQTGAVLLAFDGLKLDQDLTAFGAGSSKGISLSNSLSTNGEVRVHIGDDVVGGQLYNFGLSPNQPHVIQIGDTIAPGKGAGFRVSGNLNTRFGFCWEE